MGSENTAERVTGDSARNSNWGTAESVSGALEAAKGNKTEAAKLLGVSRIALRNKITELAAKTTISNGSGHIDVVSEVFRRPLYDLAILRPDNWTEKRLCFYCSLPFLPKRPNDWFQHFCCKEHKIAFHQYGYLPFDKMMVAVREEITRIVKSLLKEKQGE